MSFLSLDPLYVVSQNNKTSPNKTEKVSQLYVSIRYSLKKFINEIGHSKKYNFRTADRFKIECYGVN